MTEILPNLWNTNFNNINIISNEQNIDLIINCSSEKIKTKIETINFYIDINHLNYDNFEVILSYIHKKLLSFKNVLISCIDGNSLSSLLILTYIIKYSKIDVDLSLKFLQSKKNNTIILNYKSYNFLHKFISS